MRVDEQQFSYLIGRMKADDSVDAPEGAVKFAKNLYRTRMTPKASVLQRIKAVWVNDLMPGKFVFGERSASAASPRQVLFDAGEYAIDLRISPLDDSFSIRGQVLGFGFEHGNVSIGSYRALIDELGQFELTGVPAGKYEILVKRDDLELIVEGFILD